MLRLLALPASLWAFILAATAQSRPIVPLHNESVPGKHHYHDLPSGNGQQPLIALDDNIFGLSTHRPSIPPPRHVSAMEHFDAQEDSIGVLLMPADGEAEVLHLWLPIGKRVYTRDSPALPLHPVTARMTARISTTPSIASAEQLDQIVCDVWVSTGEMVAGFYDGVRGERKISFSRNDGLVQFARGGDEKFWLGGKEVQSYECHL